MKLITKTDYVNNSDLHDEYYGQFVNNSILLCVKRGIGEERIKKSKDHHFNDIPLRGWDGLDWIVKDLVDKRLLKAVQEMPETEKYFLWSPNWSVCVAKAAARMIKDGMYINLGLGLPSLVNSFVPESLQVVFHSENGILGYGRVTENEEEWDTDLVNAGGQPVVLNNNIGPSFFDSVLAFTMIRGRHLDMAILGAYQVSEKGDLANWATTEKARGSIGGAMDIAFGGAKRFDPKVAPHHHLHCIRCARVFDFYSGIYDNLKVPIEIDEQFQILSKRVLLKGVCKDCHNSKTTERRKK